MGEKIKRCLLETHLTGECCILRIEHLLVRSCQLTVAFGPLPARQFFSFPVQWRQLLSVVGASCHLSTLTGLVTEAWAVEAGEKGEWAICWGGRALGKAARRSDTKVRGGVLS